MKPNLTEPLSRRSTLALLAGSAGAGLWPGRVGAVDYQAPGVYIEELPGATHPIAAVGTSSPAIFGIAPDPAASLRAPTLVSSYTDFSRHFGAGTGAKNVLANAVAGFFQNGGGYCYVVNLGAAAGDSVTPADLQTINAIDGISLVLAPGFADAGSTDALIGHCEDSGDRFAIVDTPREIDPIDRLTRIAGNGVGLRPRTAQDGCAAVYTPWLQVRDAQSGETVDQPPSGHIAGIYAFTEATLGVHKAPANVIIRGALGLTRAITDAEQEILNPNGVNCIRAIPGRGILVWGARTLGDQASPFRYVNVRRLVTMVRHSIMQGTRWVVFEPNDEALWASVRRDVGAFLEMLWREGALAGNSANEAYFVQCGHDTMTQTDIDNGRLHIIIGVAPSRPAEYLIQQITQSV